MIVCKDLTIGYTNPIVDNINVTINDNEFVFVVGKNGSGKSTFIKTILNILEPLSGSFSNTFKSIGYTSQDINKNSDFPSSVFEVVSSGTTTNKISFTSNNSKVDEVLARLNISHLKNQSFTKLSIGQRQKVLIARSLVANNDLLVLDEPTSNLDPNTTIEIFELLKEISKQLTVIVISHDINDIESFASLIITISDGKMESRKLC